MKTKPLRLLSFLGLILAALASLDLTGFTALPRFYGYGQWAERMTPAAFPTARLIRERGVKEVRLWHTANLGQVRPKTDSFWWAGCQKSTKIGGLGVPCGPYLFSSGMTQEDGSKEKAEALDRHISTGMSEDDARYLLRSMAVADVRAEDFRIFCLLGWWPTMKALTFPLATPPYCSPTTVSVLKLSALTCAHSARRIIIL